jgi:Tfp pilus assembly pilus retraction ATPase PilT
MVFQGVVSQRLVPRKDSNGRVPGLEVMIATPTIKQMIEEGRTPELYTAIRDSEHFGCMTFNQSLMKLYEKGDITREDALSTSDNPDEMEMLFRGIQRGASTSLLPSMGKR